jgi:hypothetical protein
LNIRINKEIKPIKYVKEKTEMTKRQIWDLMEIYWKMQNAKTIVQYNEAFEELHQFIELNCLNAVDVAKEDW